MNLFPPVVQRFALYAFAALGGYLPAWLILNFWPGRRADIVAYILLLPSPIALTLHFGHLTAEPIHFLAQCACLGCTAAAGYFLGRRQGWIKT